MEKQKINKAVGRNVENKDQKAPHVSRSSDERPQTFCYDDLKNATNNFSSKIGEGRFGPVYKASLENAKSVAVKKLVGDQGENLLVAANMTLAFLKHPSLINLKGSCTETERLLVYEFIPSATSLDKRLHDSKNYADSKPLDWETRMSIALGTARGLSYLHNIEPKPVLFCDLKASKILLDNNSFPRLSGWGLAKFGDQTHVSTAEGYYAPEYCASRTPMVESDVYSFGVILLELTTGRRPKDIIKEQGKNTTLYDWYFSKKEEEYKLYEVVDPVVRGNTGTRGSLFKAAELSLRCIDKKPHKRPTMSTVVKEMEEVLFLAKIKIGQGSSKSADASKGKGKDKVHD